MRFKLFLILAAVVSASARESAPATPAGERSTSSHSPATR